MADRRRLNKVSWERNPRGEYFVFGKVGSGENSYIKTLAYRKTKASIVKVAKKYERYVGLPIKEVPRDKR